MSAKPNSGLTELEARTRLMSGGFNELESSKPKSAFRIIFDVLKEPMFILLVSCSTLYIVLGDVTEGIILMSSVSVILVITFFQERRTERALDALKNLASPRALVIRDGVEKRIAAREVVEGDTVVLLEGDRVCADARLMSSTNLTVDESLLTGESAPVLKTDDGRNEDSNRVYSGTLVVQGKGVAIVISTGSQTRFGMIGEMLREVKEEPTLLHKETGRIVRIFSVIGMMLCVVLVIIFGIIHNDWLRGLLSGLSLAMAMVPEEFAVVLTIFMALGAWKMSKQNVLTRRPQAIETLGAVTVICSDKTGTLTMNEMSVRKFYSQDRTFTIEEVSRETPRHVSAMIRCCILASQQNPFDPMERAFHKLNSLVPAGTLDVAEPVAGMEYPLSASLLAVSHAYRQPDGTHLVACKGSPEAVVGLCRLSPQQSETITRQTKELASSGLRVLGVAKANFIGETMPRSQVDFNFQFLGLIALEDPLRNTVKGDLETCYHAGIRMIMVTGDYPTTAESIARQMGLKNAQTSISGSQLAMMTDAELRSQIATINIFARVSPEQKLRIVNALKDNGEIVAMTGDGINDAPSLKAAHIGIAMGQRGTDVAREASALVLLDDNFSSVVNAIKTGRKIYDNMKKAMAFVFAVHIPIAGLTLIPALFLGAPILLMPLHIAFLELVIDPACTLIFEGESAEKNIMHRHPRKSTKPIFDRRRVILSSLQGISVLLVALTVAFISIYLGRPEDEVRALTFTTLVMSNIGLILINRSWTRTIWEMFRARNAAALWVTGSIGLILLLVLYIPGLRKVFHFDVLHVHDLAICFVASALSITWFEAMKVVSRLKRNRIAIVQPKES
jgi:Ca2+-transporting ATPase